jgi:hypothetical protein
MYPNHHSEHGATWECCPTRSSIDNAGALSIGVQISETAKNSHYVQESVAGVAYGLGWLLALDNPRGRSLLDQKEFSGDSNAHD